VPNNVSVSCGPASGEGNKVAWLLAHGQLRDLNILDEEIGASLGGFSMNTKAVNAGKRSDHLRGQATSKRHNTTDDTVWGLYFGPKSEHDQQNTEGLEQGPSVDHQRFLGNECHYRVGRVVLSTHQAKHETGLRNDGS